MTDSDIQRIVDDLERRLKPALALDRHACEMMHRGLVDEFKSANQESNAQLMKTIDADRTAFRKAMIEARDNIFESATGKPWADREQVRGGILFAIAAKSLSWKILSAIAVVAVIAWMGLH